MSPLSESESVKLVYLVLYDRDTPRVGASFASPIDGAVQEQAVDITDTELLADIEALHAKVALKMKFDRTPA